MDKQAVFVDTSCFFAVLDKDDDNHVNAAGVWHGLLTDEYSLITSNYIILETSALLQHRINLGAAKLFQNDILPVVSTVWVTSSTHQAAVALWQNQSRRKLSLVDCSSFVLMQEANCHTAFTLDKHFKEQGYSILP